MILHPLQCHLLVFREQVIVCAFFRHPGVAAVLLSAASERSEAAWQAEADAKKPDA